MKTLVNLVKIQLSDYWMEVILSNPRRCSMNHRCSFAVMTCFNNSMCPMEITKIDMKHFVRFDESNIILFSICFSIKKSSMVFTLWLFRPHSQRATLKLVAQGILNYKNLRHVLAFFWLHSLHLYISLHLPYSKWLFLNQQISWYDNWTAIFTK